MKRKLISLLLVITMISGTFVFPASVMAVTDPISLGIVLSNDSPNVGEKITATITVTANAAQTGLKLSTNNNQAWSIGSLKKGDKKAYTTQLSYAKEGKHEFTAQVTTGSSNEDGNSQGGNGKEKVIAKISKTVNVLAIDPVTINIDLSKQAPMQNETIEAYIIITANIVQPNLTVSTSNGESWYISKLNAGERKEFSTQLSYEEAGEYVFTVQVSTSYKENEGDQDEDDQGEDENSQGNGNNQGQNSNNQGQNGNIQGQNSNNQGNNYSKVGSDHGDDNAQGNYSLGDNNKGDDSQGDDSQGDNNDNQGDDNDSQGDDNGQGENNGKGRTKQKIIAEKSVNISVLPNENAEPLEITLEAEKLILLIEEEIWIDAGVANNAAVTFFEVYVDGNVITTEPGRYNISFETPGQKKIEVIARNAAENEAYSMLELTVIEPENNSPVITGRVEKTMQLDIAAAFGDVSLNREREYKDALEQVKENLEARGVSVTLSGLGNVYTAPDLHTWDIYEHQNYTGAYRTADLFGTPWPRAHSIWWDEGNITMHGFTVEAYKDFLYKKSDNPEEKRLSFEYQRDTTNWHSVEGGGFLFNTHIGYDSSRGRDTIEGYALIMSASGLDLYRINKTNLDLFVNGKTSYSGSANALLARYGPLLLRENIGSGVTLYNKFQFDLIVSPTHISVFIDGRLVIDNYRLPNAAVSYGFGPFAAHGSHSCSQLSYFTFSNIYMEEEVDLSLLDIVDSHEFTPGATRSIVHISDGEVGDLNEHVTGRMAAVINAKGINYIAASSEDSTEEFAVLLQNAINGAELDNQDI